jgi:hypothetical protein
MGQVSGDMGMSMSMSIGMSMGMGMGMGMMGMGMGMGMGMAGVLIHRRFSSPCQSVEHTCESGFPPSAAQHAQPFNTGNFLNCCEVRVEL